MPKGPLGGPRPLAEYRVIIDPHEPDVHLVKVGPLGFVRPFAKNNPPVEQSRVDECVISRSGRRFGAAVASDGRTKSFADLTPPEKREALEVTEKWCEGTLESTAMEDLTEREASQLRRTVEQQIDQMLEAGQEFEVEALEGFGGSA